MTSPYARWTVRAAAIERALTENGISYQRLDTPPHSKQRITWLIETSTGTLRANTPEAEWYIRGLADARERGNRRQRASRNPSPSIRNPREIPELPAATHLAPKADTAVARRFYTVAEVADTFRVTRKHIFDLLRRGDVASVKLGRRRLIPASEVDRFEAGLIAAAELQAAES